VNLGTVFKAKINLLIFKNSEETQLASISDQPVNVCSHINTRCGQNLGFFNVKLMVLNDKLRS